MDDIRPGPPNENCFGARKRDQRDRSVWPPDHGLCQHQQVTFQIISLSNAQLFVRPPVVTSDGTLRLQPAPHANGLAEVRLILVDDGAQLGYTLGHNTSKSHDFNIYVTPVNDPPHFKLPWRVTCDFASDDFAGNDTIDCSCPALVIMS